MLWNLARLLRDPAREVFTEAPTDAPPEKFVEKISDEGGDVYVAPVLEALRATLRAKRGQADPSTSEPQGATRSPRSEGAP